MVENQKKRKPTFVHEEPRDTKDKSDDGHASHDMLCVPTMQRQASFAKLRACVRHSWDHPKFQAYKQIQFGLCTTSLIKVFVKSSSGPMQQYYNQSRIESF
ncbi:hypothetical protein NC653_020967 [Populus alba x Populus x berolinensis]|uniref:Uncharacterized protein n=1 Tax=Populus alba x Populus x berolinensis TaxID=444605 RepID=A0AAD6MM70_9ROSI|nr:hypothetical protein NC653_020967 [Populus alba x Populus x berolinensis]